MATERTPMEELRYRLSGSRNNVGLTDARIRAHMIVAMIDGADKGEVAAMADAVGLRLSDADEPDTAN